MALKAVKPSSIEKAKKLKVCVFGKPSVGKTWHFSLEFPKCYYIDAEAGANFKEYLNKLESKGGVYFGIDQGASDFDTVIKELKELATTRHNYQTVAITLSKLWLNELAKAQEKNPNVINDYGAFKKPAIIYMRQLMNWIQRIDMHVILECHETGEWETQGGERKEVGQCPDYYQKFDHELDLTLRLYNAPDLYAYVKKSRLSGFPKGTSFKCSFKEVCRRAGDITFDTTPIELITAEQLSEIQSLLKVIKIDNKELERIFAKAMATEWTELNTQQASQTIDWLKGKIK